MMSKQFKFFIVGGKNRDDLLGIPNKDVDYAVECSGFDQLVEYLKQQGARIFLVEPRFMTVRCQIRGSGAFGIQGNVDLVVCRKDGMYRDRRRPDETTVGTILDDLARRDLTINAIAYNVESGVYLDPHDGKQDLEKRVIRCVGSATERLTEDPLRIARVVRFFITLSHQTGTIWTVCPDILQHIRSNREDILLVARERVYEEFRKIFRVVSLGSFYQMIDRIPEFRDLVGLVFDQILTIEPKIRQ